MRRPRPASAAGFGSPVADAVVARADDAGPQIHIVRVTEDR